MRIVMKLLYALCLIAVIMFIVGMCQLPQTGGDIIPQGESQEEYNKRQRQIVITSSGFKLAMAGMGLGAITICLIAYRANVEEAEFYREEAARQRRAQAHVAPLVLTMAEPVKALAVDSPKPIPMPVKQEFTQVAVEEPEQLQAPPHIQIHKPLELYPYPPRYHPRAPVPFPQRVRFQYPPAYAAFNKK